MFYTKSLEAIQCKIEESSPSSVLVRIENPSWQYQKLENTKFMLNTFSRFCLVFDLSEVQQMTTAAFAQLVMIKGLLHQVGSDLHVQGLQEQPKALCEILKLTDILAKDFRKHRVI